MKIGCVRELKFLFISSTAHPQASSLTGEYPEEKYLSAR